jgi:hypothetical protein
MGGTVFERIVGCREVVRQQRSNLIAHTTADVSSRQKGRLFAGGQLAGGFEKLPDR